MSAVEVVEMWLGAQNPDCRNGGFEGERRKGRPSRVSLVAWPLILGQMQDHRHAVTTRPGSMQQEYRPHAREFPDITCVFFLTSGRRNEMG